MRTWSRRAQGAGAPPPLPARPNFPVRCRRSGQRCAEWLAGHLTFQKPAFLFFGFGFWPAALARFWAGGLEKERKLRTLRGVGIWGKNNPLFPDTIGKWTYSHVLVSPGARFGPGDAGPALMGALDGWFFCQTPAFLATIMARGSEKHRRAPGAGETRRPGGGGPFGTPGVRFRNFRLAG
ncbi:MAG: hypothetical protein CM15mP55_2610 [Hyphomicrobiales bacterium]|nr:MAG: hypothetical protein CM15mP55_2610 [Hyphomicrobiales bacterium]